MTLGLVWLWFWFIGGESLNVLKRAYFKVSGADPAITTYKAYIVKYWPALVFRGVFGAGLYWLTFYPDAFSKIASIVHWNASIPSLPQIAPVALFTGIGIDSILDFIASKIPLLQGQIPPLNGKPQQAPPSQFNN